MMRDGDPSGWDRYLAFFSEAAKKQQISHAYIIEGESGTKKRELAVHVARMLLCEKKTGCGSCHSCRAVEKESHPDLIFVRHEKEDVIRIDEIREQLVDDISIRPYGGDYKIYIVDDAEMMNVAAQNALLKTLEEPPYYGIIFLLTVNADGFLPTILSRAVRLKLSSAGTGLETVPEEELREVAAVLEDAAHANRTRLARAAADWKEKQIPFSRTGMIIRCWFRDVLVWKSIGDSKRIWCREYLSGIRKAAEEYSYPQINQILLAVDQAEARINRNVNYELTVELLLAKMKLPERELQIADDGWEDSYFPDYEEALFYSQMQEEYQEDI